MTLHHQHDLTRVINARGTFTPLGVSRSSSRVGERVAEALGQFFVISELQDVASRKIAAFAGAEAGTITHCTAASITLSVAAAMTGLARDRIASLPNSSGMPDRVVLPATHAVNYGHPIEQAVRLSGARPVLAGTAERCSVDDIENEASEPGTACILLVVSRLVRGADIDIAEVVRVARRCRVPVIVDGAAQDRQIDALLDRGADLLLVSAQKYLAAPTAGIVIGKASLVDAVRAQEAGIGRPMKASKEAIIGTLAALEERATEDHERWTATQADKASAFVDKVAALHGVRARTIADTSGEFSRVHLAIDKSRATMDATTLANRLKSGEPSVWVMNAEGSNEAIMLELVQLTEDEVRIVVDRLTALLMDRT